MYSVMIAEDELLVQIGLKSMIKWDKFNMKITAEASNGSDAYELFLKEKPNLILTDIKMPVMDGIELISKIRAVDSKVKIIILTSYKEFDYAYQALKLGVSGYFLKLKMSTEEMEAEIRKVQDELDKEAVNKIHEASAIPINKEKLILDFFINEENETDSFTKNLIDISPRMEGSKFLVCIMSLFQESDAPYQSINDKRQVDFILNLVDKIFNRVKNGEIVHLQNGKYLLLFSFADVENGKQKLYSCLNEIGSNIATYTNKQAIFGLSRIIDQDEGLHHLFHDALSALNQVYFSMNQCQLMYGDESIDVNYLFQINKLRESIDSRADLDKKYQAEIIATLQKLTESAEIREETVKRQFVHLINWAVYSLYEKQNETNEYLDLLSLEFKTNINNARSLIDTIDIFVHYLNELAKMKPSKPCVSHRVRQAVQYIHENFMSDISLSNLSEKVEVSENYFSSLFRKEMGINITPYINKVRIDAARELLGTTDLKIYEVALRVGIADECYFSRLFKNTTGVSPYEFKKSRK